MLISKFKHPFYLVVIDISGLFMSPSTFEINRLRGRYANILPSAQRGSYTRFFTEWIMFNLEKFNVISQGEILFLADNHKHRCFSKWSEVQGRYGKTRRNGESLDMQEMRELSGKHGWVFREAEKDADLYIFEDRMKFVRCFFPKMVEVECIEKQNQIAFQTKRRLNEILILTIDSDFIHMFPACDYMPIVANLQEKDRAELEVLNWHPKIFGKDQMSQFTRYVHDLKSDCEEDHKNAFDLLKKMTILRLKGITTSNDYHSFGQQIFHPEIEDDMKMFEQAYERMEKILRFEYMRHDNMMIYLQSNVIMNYFSLYLRTSYPFFKKGRVNMLKDTLLSLEYNVLKHFAWKIQGDISFYELRLRAPTKRKVNEVDEDEENQPSQPKRKCFDNNDDNDNNNDCESNKRKCEDENNKNQPKKQKTNNSMVKIVISPEKLMSNEDFNKQVKQNIDLINNQSVIKLFEKEFKDKLKESEKTVMFKSYDDASFSCCLLYFFSMLTMLACCETKMGIAPYANLANSCWAFVNRENKLYEKDENSREQFIKFALVGLPQLLNFKFYSSYQTPGNAEMVKELFDF